MDKMFDLLKRHWVASLGFLVLFFYLSSAFQIINYPRQLFLILFLAISPVAIVGVIAIGNLLVDNRNKLSVQIGRVFGIIGFAIFEIMMCVQQGSRIFFKEHLLNESQSNISQNIAKAIYQGVNSVQFTMDIAFDIFYCLLIILYSYEMFRSIIFGKIVSVFGIVSGTALLVLNLWTFPYPPAESGLIDLGPLTGIWWIWVIILIIKNDPKRKNV